jgi:hypothetical protein
LTVVKGVSRAFCKLPQNRKYRGIFCRFMKIIAAALR